MPNETPVVGIRPYYQMLGGLLVAGTVAILVILAIKGTTLQWPGIAGCGLLLLGGLAMLLPEVFKSVIAALPWTKFTGNSGS